jgi:hypothetical protein
MDLVSNWVVGPLILLVWSTKAFLWVCDSSSNKLLLQTASHASRGVFCSPGSAAYNVVLLDAGESGTPLKCVFGGMPTLVLNMNENLFAQDTLISDAVTVVSLNKPAYIKHAHARVVYVETDEEGKRVLSRFACGKEEAIAELMVQTRDAGVPSDFDPAHDLLFAFPTSPPLDNVDEELCFSDVDMDAFFCSNRGCEKQSNSEFDCTQCGGLYCSAECREITCDKCPA